MNTDERLLDVLLGKEGRGAELLQTYGTLQHIAQCVDALPVTPRQKDRLRAAFQLRFLHDAAEVKAMNSPAEVFQLVSDLQLASQEHVVVLVLNTRNGLIHREDVYKGSVNMSTIRIAEIFRPAIVHNGSAIVVVHNHPSGDPSPSPDDVAVTRTIVEAGKLFDIDVLDHIIVGAGRFESLKTIGLGFG